MIADETISVPTLPKPTPLRELVKLNPHLRHPVIDFVIRRGQVANVVNAAKAGKTWAMFALAINFALGKPWLGTFATAGGRVLLVDLELQPPDIATRLAMIADAMGVALDEVDELIDVLPLRGMGAVDIERELTSYEPREYALVILDPMYKLYPPGFDENKNADMSELYRRFERCAEHLDAGLIVVHHSTKGSQADKDVTGVGAGGGAQSRAADCHIALREHSQPNCAVLEIRCRSFEPHEPIVLEWQTPLWVHRPDLDPRDLKRSARRKKAEPKPAKEKPVAMTVEEFAGRFITGTPQPRQDIIAIATGAGIVERAAGRLLTEAVAKHIAAESRAKGRGGKLLISIATPPTGA